MHSYLLIHCKEGTDRRLDPICWSWVCIVNNGSFRLLKAKRRKEKYDSLLDTETAIVLV